ncbi:MAG: hypothetical protein ACKPB0_19710, partial [Opitutaceae bacterium]
MNTKPPQTALRWAKLSLLLLGWFAVCLPAWAQGSGTVQGRVFNPATGEYVRDAEVRLDGSGQVVYSANDGSFTLL